MQPSRLLLVCVLNFEQVFLFCMSLSMPTLFLRKQGGSYSSWIASMKALETPLPASPKLARRAGVTCETIMGSGIPSEEILRTITSKKIDLAILGTNALHGFERLVFGSTAEAVLRKALCPVLTVGPQASDAARAAPNLAARLSSRRTSTSTRPMPFVMRRFSAKRPDLPSIACMCFRGRSKAVTGVTSFLRL